MRAAERNQTILESRLKQLVKGLGRENGQPTIVVCRRALMPMDYSINLFHDSGKVENAGSPLGLQLVAVLKELGLVNHSIWNDVTAQYHRPADNEK